MSRAKNGRLIRHFASRVLLGAAFYAVGVGQPSAAEFPSSVDVGSLNGSSGLRLFGGAAGENAGSAVAAGDVNGDGIADLIVGAAGANGSGAVYVVFGKTSSFPSFLSLSSLSGTNGFRLDGVASSDALGFSVDVAGDINGDGFDDIIASAPYANSPLTNAGSSYILFGKASGFSSASNVSALTGANGFRLDGVAVFENSGKSVSAAGDVNGDGIDDIIVGVEKADNNGADSGSSFVMFGKKSSFSSAINLSVLSGQKGFRIDGAAAGDNSGMSVSEAGDVNGDGIGDIVIGAGNADNNGGESGSAYVIFGKTTSFSSVLNLASLTGTNGFRIDGNSVTDRAGHSVSAAGDINGDGFGDVLVGAAYAGFDAADSGTSYVVFGKASGFSSVVDLGALPATDGFRIDGTAADDRSGSSVAAAGDINGDGFDDILVGAPFAEPIGTANSGASYLIFGKATNFATSLNLSALSGVDGFRMVDGSGDDRLGASVSSAGDVNGDGFGDIILGAQLDDFGGLNSGTAHVIFGRRPDASVIRMGSVISQTIQGGDFADGLAGVGGNDVLEGRGGGDVLDGSVGTNTASYAHSASGVTANLANPALNTNDAEGDSYFGIQNLEGSVFSDILTGNASANRIWGGGNSNDDYLKGGGGKDTFIFRSATDSLVGPARDEIADFSPGTGSSSVDKIDVSQIDAKSAKKGNQAFSFRGTKPFNAPGQLRIKKSGGDIIVEGNTTGNGGAEFEILLKGLKNTSAFTAKDFKL
jgi:hypothetical protein